MRNKKLVLTVVGVVLAATVAISCTVVVFNHKDSKEVATAPTEVTEVVTLTDEEKADFEDLKKKTIEEIEALNKDSNEEVDTVVKAFVEKLNGIKVDDFTVYADLEKEVASVKEEAEKAVNNKVAELAAKAEEERLAAEEAARVEAERLATEEAERLAAEEAAKAEQTASSSSSKKNSSSKSNGSSSSSASSSGSNNTASASNDYVSDDDRLETEEEQMRRDEESKKLQEMEVPPVNGDSWVAAPAYDEEKAQQATDDILNDIPVVGE